MMWCVRIGLNPIVHGNNPSKAYSHEGQHKVKDTLKERPCRVARNNPIGNPQSPYDEKARVWSRPKKAARAMVTKKPNHTSY